MKKVNLMFCLILIVFMSSCAATKENRISHIKSQYPQWDQATVQNVADRNIMVGMTEEMVFEAMGKAWDISHKGAVMTWGYGYFTGGSDGATTQKIVYYIDFRDKKVIGTRGSKESLGRR